MRVAVCVGCGLSVDVFEAGEGEDHGAQVEESVDEHGDKQASGSFVEVAQEQA